MAFKEKIFLPGNLASQKMGQQVTIYDKYMATSGEDKSDVIIYERSDVGVWEELKTLSLADSSNFGRDIELYKGVLIASRVHALDANQLVRVYDGLDNFSSFVSLTPSVAGGVFGNAVSLSDNYIAVGAPELDANKGRVYIYEKDGSSWNSAVEDYYVEADNPIANHYFGTSVAINDNFLIVGAKGDNASKGAIYVFKRNEETGIFEQSQKVIASDGVSGDEFGGKVSLSDDYLAVSSEFADLSDQQVNVGAVYMFNYSNRWNELRKIVGFGESGLIANHFGHSINLNGDYLIVGSPNAQNSGVADIFYKKRNWGHLKKLDSTATTIGDSFGESVAIHYPYSAAGAFGYSGGLGDEGGVYVYEDPPIRLRLAQEFDVNDEFVPSKASVYLKRSGSNSNESWALQDDRFIVMNATNFSSISQSSNKVIFDDRITGFTGNGYMAMSPEADLDIINGNSASFSAINYPIRNSVPDSYNIWIRCSGDVFDSISSDPSISDDPSGSVNYLNFAADILIDGIVVESVSSVIIEGEWSWLWTTIVLPDTQQHTLGIRIKEKGGAIDKIYIDADPNKTPDITPVTGDGPSYSTSPYVTVHMKVYESFGLTYPVYPLYIYDYKTTLDEIIQDDWYNFNISVLDSRVWHGDIAEYDNNFFLVMTSSGKTSDNFVIWEMINSDEYLSTSSAIRI